MELHGITQVAKNIGGVISKNSPTILTGVAVAGLISTTIMGINTTPKALMILDDRVWAKYEEEVDNLEDVSFEEWIGTDKEGYSWSERINMLSKREIIKLTWKTYLPTITLGVVTIVCIIGANSISLRRNAALAGLYGITEVAFKEYQAKVVETIGKNKELKVRDEISADRVKKNPPGGAEVIFTGKGEVMCYDSLSGRYFKNDVDKIRKAVNTLNYNLRSEMFVTVNDLYYAIGLSGTKMGDMMGWDIDKGEILIDFSAQLTENDEPCLVMNYKIEPRFMN